jgi:hypothetical protein
MQQSQHSVENGSGELTVGLGLWYDSERLMLEGVYLDEVTAYRARKGWIEAFETNFLLEDRIDFRVRVVQLAQKGRFGVTCEFLTACGRYAFWRLTHHQAPEVQFILETAHLPAFSGIPEAPLSFGGLEGHDVVAPPVPERANEQAEVWERIRDICSAIMSTTGSLLKRRPRR